MAPSATGRSAASLCSGRNWLPPSTGRASFQASSRSSTSRRWGPPVPVQCLQRSARSHNRNLLSAGAGESPAASRGSSADAGAARVPAIISEANSVSCGGMAGVSNSPASAVWAVRFVLSALKTGFREVRFHLSVARMTHSSSRAKRSSIGRSRARWSRSTNATGWLVAADGQRCKRACHPAVSGDPGGPESFSTTSRHEREP